MYQTFTPIRWFGGACVLLALAACEPQGAGPTDLGAATSGATPAPAIRQETLEMRPDIYSRHDLAGWDGRPSLGGAWIAHPDVGSAERASITEVATGREIMAALFRRDPSIPGPPFQLSAEAANQLGVTAGVPVEVHVVAVRTNPTAAARVQEAVDTEASAEPMPEPAAAPVEAAVIAAVPVEEPEIVEVATLPASDPVAEPVEVAAPSSPPATPPAARESAPERPYMQVGVFGVAANASALVERLTAEGLQARAVPSGALTRVIVGPAASSAELALIRDKVRELGFTDALAVSR